MEILKTAIWISANICPWISAHLVTIACELYISEY